jgi:hypothetical protein
MNGIPKIICHVILLYTLKVDIQAAATYEILERGEETGRKRQKEEQKQTE